MRTKNSLLTISMETHGIKQQILWEDEDIIVLNKFPSQIVQSDKYQNVSLAQEVENYLKETQSDIPFCGIVHRLDRRVSGACVFAKNKKMLAALNSSLKNGNFKKLYWAIIQNHPEKEEDTLMHYLQKNETINKSFVVTKETQDAKNAVLHYKLVAVSERYFMLEVELKTGRHHQIRAQLSYIGCPIKGDLKYGAKRSNPDGSISLHAREIQLIHPKTNDLIKITAPTPIDNLWAFFTQNQ